MFFCASVCSMAVGNYHRSDINTQIISKLVNHSIQMALSLPCCLAEINYAIREL